MSHRKLALPMALLLFVATFAVWLPDPMAQATSATFSQKILPLDCVFQEVNDGTGTLIYLTPEECGVILTPPPTPGGGQTTTTLVTSGNPVYLQTDNPQPQTDLNQSALQPQGNDSIQIPKTRDFATTGSPGIVSPWLVWFVIVASSLLVAGWAWWLIVGRKRRR